MRTGNEAKKGIHAGTGLGMKPGLLVKIDLQIRSCWFLFFCICHKEGGGVHWARNHKPAGI